ncbi:helix-turn-helix transcriptional regulator [Caballeronia sp. M23-90]
MEMTCTGRAMRPTKAAEHLGIAVSTFWQYARTDPDFPKGIKISHRVTLFMEEDLAKWLSLRASRRAA